MGQHLGKDSWKGIATFGFVEMAFNSLSVGIELTPPFRSLRSGSGVAKPCLLRSLCVVGKTLLRNARGNVLEANDWRTGLVKEGAAV
jgi:hypothetical protein